MIGKIFRFFIPKLFVIASLILALWIGNVTLKEMNRGQRIQEEITSLHTEAQKTQKENTLLQEKIRYFQTDAFQEQEARNKLNYQSPDEQVVVITPSVLAESVKSESDAPISSQARDFLPNYEKWWNQFFAI